MISPLSGQEVPFDQYVKDMATAWDQQLQAAAPQFDLVAQQTIHDLTGKIINVGGAPMSNPNENQEAQYLAPLFAQQQAQLNALDAQAAITHQMLNADVMAAQAKQAQEQQRLQAEAQARRDAKSQGWAKLFANMQALKKGNPKGRMSINDAMRLS